jgi:ribonucleoside-diphosphate reductase alpha chain
VAKAYILYRFEHTKERTQKVIEKIEEGGLMVTKRDGNKEAFSLEKVRRSIKHHIQDVEKDINVDEIVNQCQTEIYDGISTADVSRAIIMVCRSMIERGISYSRLAARLLTTELNKEALGIKTIDYARLDEQYRAALEPNIKKAVALKKLAKEMHSFDFKKLSKALRPERDDLFQYLGVETLNDRYLVKEPETKRTLETLQFFWMRVAMGLALNEKNKDKKAIEFYEMISTFRFVPSTPTLYHAGMPRPQLSSCYLNTVEDDLYHIFKVYGDNAQLSKWAGGIGTDWSSLRGTGALIKKAGIHSQGVIPFLKIANDVTVAINRSGRRRGATCAYLETWHYDVEDFLELRKNTGDERRRTHDMNTANWIPDLFMKRVRDDGEWTLFSPDETPELHHVYGKKFDELYEAYEKKADNGEIILFKRLKARTLWKKMLAMLFETGHPWATFKDPSNIRSPQDHVGVIHNSNLCTEITLNTSADETAVCNLGWVNLSRHVVGGVLDREKIRETITSAMYMLDNVIDLNFYPTIEAKNSNTKHRPVGLGVGGFQDALYELDIYFDSDKCVEFADECQELISYHAILTSSIMARERGTYPSYKGSKWDRGIFPIDTIALLEDERGEEIPVDRSASLDWSAVREHVKLYGMRNSNTMAIAPTASTSTIVGCTPTIEPMYKNIYVKSNISGDFIVVNPYLINDLKQVNLWNEEMLGKLKYHDGSVANIPEIPEHIKRKYKETFEIDMHWILKAAAYRGKWIDQSQSVNIFFSGSSGEELSALYMYAWQLGLKTTYYLRTRAASQVEKSTVNASEYGSTHTRDMGKKDTEIVMKNLEEATGATTAKPESISPLSRVSSPKPNLYVATDSICEACE